MIKVTTLSPADYADLRWRALRFVEEKKGDPSELPYVDGVGLPTIGVGFNLEADAAAWKTGNSSTDNQVRRVGKAQRAHAGGAIIAAAWAGEACPPYRANAMGVEMAFVYEKIAEADKGKAERIVAGLRKHIPTGWVVDREQDALLLCLSVYEGGSSGGLPGRYVLFWKDAVIQLRVLRRERRNDEDTGNIHTYCVTQVRIPEELADRREKVLELVRCALDAFGWTYRYVTDVNVEIEA